MDNLYLFLMIASISFPLLRSFEPRLKFSHKWYALFPAIAIVDVFFLVWDILFTQYGIWGFDSRYLVGIDIVNLPIEEWLFFIFIPYACVFIYEATLYFIRIRYLHKIASKLTILLAFALFVMAMLNLDRWYTALTFSSAAFLLFFHVLFIKRDYLDRFWFGYLFSLIPFLIVNGVLTGSFLAEPIVWYNDDENLGIRIFSIPIEDSIYLLLYLLSIISIYESILKRFPMVNPSMSSTS